MELTLAGSASASGAGGPLEYGYGGTGLTQWAFNVVVSEPGIALTVQSSYDGTSGTWAVSYDGPGAPFGGYIVGGTGYQDTRITAKIRGLLLYSQLTGALYNISCDGIDLYVNGAFEITLPGSGFNETSTGCGPCYITILGVPLLIEGGVSGGVDTSWAYDPCDVSDVAGGNWNYSVSGAISGGWRFKEDGEEDWQTLPVFVENKSAPSSGDCPYGLSTAGIVSCTNTWNAQINCLAAGSGELDYRGRVNGQAYILVSCAVLGDDPAPPPVRIDTDDKCTDPCPPEGEDSQVDPYRDEYRQDSMSESASGSICILPNLEKSIRRLGYEDTKALLIRLDFPSVVGRATRACQIDEITDTTSADFEFFPGSLAFLAAMGASEHPFEDFLALPTIAPTIASRSKSESTSYPVYYPEVCSVRAATPEECEAICGPGGACFTTGDQEFPDMPEGTSKSESVSFNSLYSVSGVSNYQAHASPLLTYVGTWGNILWHYCHFLDNYGGLNFVDYWGPGRQQHLSNAGLPPEDQTDTRTDVIGSCFEDSGHTPTMDVTFGHRWLGTSRNRLYTPTIPSECQTNADAVWNFGEYDEGTETWDGTGTVGATTVTVGTTTTKATLDALSFTDYPFMYPLICDRIQIPASGFTNVDSFSVKLIGIDGSEVELCTASGTHVIPKGANVKYAGSWGIQNSPDPGTTDDLGVDATGDGISAALMADPLHCSAFSLLPARSYYRLRYDVVKTNPSLTATVPHPIFKRNATTPKMYWESGHIQTLLWPNGSALRLGNWDFYLQGGGGFQNPPVIKASSKTTIIDALCTIRLIFEARAADDGLTTELATMFDTNEGQSIGVVDKFSAAWINPGESNHSTVSSLQWSLINTMAEAPPLGCFPNRSFVIGSAEWSQTGPYKHQVLEWSQEPRYLIHPTNRMDQEDATGPALITVPATAPLGWAITTHQVAVDNTETPSWDINRGATKFADATPWRGYFGILDIAEIQGKNVTNLVTQFGYFVRAYSKSDGIEVQYSTFHAPPIYLGVSSPMTMEGDDFPKLRQMKRLSRVYLVWLRPASGLFDALESYSDDFGVTWSTPETIMSAVKHVDTFSDRDLGFQGRAYFVFDSGTSGPGKIKVEMKGPGESVFGTAVNVSDGTTDFSFADAGFKIRFGIDGRRSYVLSAIKDGDTLPTDFLSTDDCLTWEEVV